MKEKKRWKSTGFTDKPLPKAAWSGNGAGTGKGEEADDPIFRMLPAVSNELMNRPVMVPMENAAMIPEKLQLFPPAVAQF